jgi:hypothetical protein
VVKLCTTCSGKNATVVELEDPLVCLDGNGHRLLCNCIFHVLEILLHNILEAGNASLGDAHSAGGSLASSSLGFVWVAFLGADGILLSILEGIVHQATIATHVSKGL